MTPMMYFLSILDNLHNGMIIMAMVCCIGGGIAFFCAHMEKDLARGEEEQTRYQAMLKRAWSLLIVAAVCFFIAFLVPTKTNIIKAYLILEGKELVNSQQAQKALIGVLDRVDRITDKMK